MAGTSSLHPTKSGVMWSFGGLFTYKNRNASPKILKTCFGLSGQAQSNSFKIVAAIQRSLGGPFTCKTQENLTH